MQVEIDGCLNVLLAPRFELTTRLSLILPPQMALIQLREPRSSQHQATQMLINAFLEPEHPEKGERYCYSFKPRLK